MKRIESINLVIDRVIDERVIEIGEIKTAANGKFIEELAAAKGIYSQLRPELSEVNQKLLGEFDDAMSRVAAIETTIAYRQGLRDGLTLPKAWGCSL